LLILKNARPILDVILPKCHFDKHEKLELIEKPALGTTFSAMLSLPKAKAEENRSTQNLI